MLRRLAIIAVCLLCCVPAWAHGGLKGASAILDGALHILTSPLSVAAISGTAAILAGTHLRFSLPIALVAAFFTGTAFLCAGYLPAYTAPLVIAVLGLIGLFGWHPPVIVAFIIAAVAGFAGGLAAELDKPTALTIIGVLMIEVIALEGIFTAYQDIAELRLIAPVLPVAKRVLGSWVAAIGLLMTALAVHQGKLS